MFELFCSLYCIILAAFVLHNGRLLDKACVMCCKIQWYSEHKVNLVWRMPTRWILVCCFSSFISLFQCNCLMSSHKSWPSTQKHSDHGKKHTLIGLNTALMCGRHVGLLRDGFCVFAVIIAIFLLKSLVSYRPYFSFLTAFHLLSLLHFQRPRPGWVRRTLHTANCCEVRVQFTSLHQRVTKHSLTEGWGQLSC